MADIFLRRDVNGITPMDLKYMNDNFKYIWLKVFGNITTGDLLDGSISEDKIQDEAITTEKISAGAITAEKIEAKTITADQIDLTTLYVGEGGIRLDSSAVITWDSLEGKPEDLVKADDLLDYVTNTMLGTALAGYVTASDLSISLANYVNKGEWDNLMIDYVQFGDIYTQIGADYVLTGKVLANNILAGEIAGVKVLTANGTNYISLQEQYLQIYYGNTPYCRLAYDTQFNNSTLKAYLQLYDWYILGDNVNLKMNLRGTDILTVSGTGISTNGISCQSLSTTNNVSIGGNLTVSGTVSFSSTAYNVTAKFA